MLETFDPHSLAYALAGLAALGGALLPRLIGRLPASPPMAFLLLGFVVFSLPLGLGKIDPLAHGVATEYLTEIGVIVALMGAGLKLDRPYNDMAKEILSAGVMKTPGSNPVWAVTSEPLHVSARALVATDPDNYFVLNRLDFMDTMAIGFGRTFLGIGTGNTATRIMGHPPLRIAELDRYLTTLRPLLRGEEVEPSWH